MRQELVLEKENKDLTMQNVIRLFRTTKVQKCEGVFAIGHRRCAIGLIYEHFFNVSEHNLQDNNCGSLDYHCKLTNFLHENGLSNLELMSYNDHSYITFKDLARELAKVYQYRKRNPGKNYLSYLR